MMKCTKWDLTGEKEYDMNRGRLRLLDLWAGTGDNTGPGRLT